EEKLQDEITRRGLILLELKRRGQTNSTVIEVIVDNETGVTLDELTDLSRWISSLLDENSDSIKGRYRLEVSTAGFDRPLEHLWQYRKNKGRLLNVDFSDDGNSVQSGVFRLIDVTPDAVTLAPYNKKNKKKEVDPQI